MKRGKGPSPNNSVDKILREIGLPPEEVPLEEVKSLEQPKAKKERGPCGKVMYGSKRAADNCVNHLLRTKTGNTSALRTYFCKECSSFHVSSSFFSIKS